VIEIFASFYRYDMKISASIPINRPKCQHLYLLDLPLLLSSYKKFRYACFLKILLGKGFVIIWVILSLYKYILVSLTNETKMYLYNDNFFRCDFPSNKRKSLLWFALQILVLNHLLGVTRFLCFWWVRIMDSSELTSSLDF